MPGLDLTRSGPRPKMSYLWFSPQPLKASQNRDLQGVTQSVLAVAKGTESRSPRR